MGVTQFPNGISSFGLPVLGNAGQIPATDGNYFFVSSTSGGASNSNSGSWDSPMATVAGAIAKTTVNNNDVIVMLPYHVESIAAAGGWTPLASTAIVGLGWGASRPKITLTATTSTILCSAANLQFQNFVTTTGISEVVTVFSVSGTDCVINAVDHVETGTYTCISWLTSTAAANRLMIEGCTHKTTTAPSGTAAWISLVGGDSITISGNNMVIAKPNAAAAAVIGCITTLTSNVNILYNNLVCLGGALNLTLTLFASSTGLAAYNNCVGAKTSCRGMIALAGAYGIQNYSNMTVNTNGILDPAVTTT